MTLRSFPSLLAFSALACAAADDGTAPVTASPVAEWEFPNIEGKRSFDCATIPADVRLEFLKGAARTYIANRLNGVHTRHEKDEKVTAWRAYEEATKADPLQSTVAKPAFDKPAEPDYEDAYNRAIADLVAGNVRRQSAEPKPRKTKDPLIAVVTDAVVRDVYASKRAADPKYTYLNAKKEVGVDGVAYLGRIIEEKVAAGTSRADLEKMLEAKYLGPARTMLGLTTSKAQSALPSIL